MPKLVVADVVNLVVLANPSTLLATCSTLDVVRLGTMIQGGKVREVKVSATTDAARYCLIWSPTVTDAARRALPL